MAAPAEAPELWCCDGCGSIGSAQQAQDHEAQTGHTVRRLNAAEAEGVREIWAAEGRDPMGRAPGRGGDLTTALLQYNRAFRPGGLDGIDF